MCGICGKLSGNYCKPPDYSLIRAMMSAMDHRGPDDDGIYLSRNVGLGHKRLSIIDLSTGKQPISNEDGKIWVVFNGEIYNYQELRRHLINKGHVFATATDTEVLVHLYEEFGEDFISKLRGMFAFALYDERAEKLMLARDRVGIKPLYYCMNGGGLVFASELKALLADPSVNREINPDAIDRLLTFYYIPGELTLLKGILKLSPGHYLVHEKGKHRIKQYWDLEFDSQPSSHSLTESVDQLTELIKESVRLHMISDVPVGFLLSGGVDSTALLSFAVNETVRDISTFTIGFEGERFADERPYARLASKKFGTKHYEMTISAKDFQNFLPKYVWHMEEPVCEPPAVALYYVSRMASEHVKVLLSGEGGDEAFAGYPNYRSMVWLERMKLASKPFNGSASYLFKAFSKLTPLKGMEKYQPLWSMPLERYYYSRTSSPYNYFNRYRQSLYTGEFAGQVGKESLNFTSGCFANAEGRDDLSRMLYIDTKTWLPDDLLVKADKMTMANSMELRVPFLDHKVMEFAWSLPSHYKLNGFTTKYILKKAFADKVPSEILNRKKTGFPVPYDRWLTADLKGFVEDTLLCSMAASRGYFQKKAIKRLLDANGRGLSYSKEIFLLVALELWHRCFIDNNGSINF